MTRGGQRQNAGRKSSWVSGVKFEETTLIRIPEKIKDDLLEIAHKIDSGEYIDLVTKLECADKKIIELQSRVLELEACNVELKNEIDFLNKLNSSSKDICDNSGADLVTKSNNYTQLDLLPNANKNNYAMISPLNNNSLAKRLNVDASNLAKQRSKGNDKLAIYSASKDPDGLAWKYIEADKLYYPVQ